MAQFNGGSTYITNLFDSSGRLTEISLRNSTNVVLNRHPSTYNNAKRRTSAIVDVCKGHGTWFDRDELRRIVEFIRSGGLDEARYRELTELENRKRRLEQSLARGGAFAGRNPALDTSALDIELSAAAEIFAQIVDL